MPVLAWVAFDALGVDAPGTRHGFPQLVIRVASPVDCDRSRSTKYPTRVGCALRLARRLFATRRF